MDTVTGNKLIAEFMGKSFEDPMNYMYDKKWDDWLMPVVEKINEMNSTGIAMHWKIDKQWDVVVSFIQWYNTQKK